jgi:hypothetical protein
LTDRREFSKLGLTKTITLLKKKDSNSMKLLTQFETTTLARLISLLLVFFGLAPMAQAVGPDTDGNIPGSNNGEGVGVLVNRTGGVWNTGTGFEALNHLTAGNQNTATGLRALNSDINGGFNTATGVFSHFSNTSGFFNSATGAYSLANNISGTSNTANGYAALYRNTADNNTATGFAALYHNTTGSDNTAVGTDALEFNVTGNSNTCLGHSTGSNLIDGEGNIYIGAQVQPGATNELEFIRIGDDTAFAFPYDTFIAGIFDRAVDVGTAVAVFVDDTGKLGTVLVDAAGNKVATPQAMLNESRNQQKRIAELEGTVERLAAMVKEQAAQIQKVSAQLEVIKPAPQVVANKP